MSINVDLNLTRLRRVLSGSPAAIDRGAHAYAEAVLDLASQLAPYDPADEGDHLRDSGTGAAAAIGFLGATPIVQQSAAANATDLATAISLVNDLKAKVQALGLLA